jgi:hypothetical protein
MITPMAIVRNIWEMIVECYKALIQIGEVPVEPESLNIMNPGTEHEVIAYFMPMHEIYHFPPKRGLNQKQKVKILK